jgi:alpha-1,2-mannosyltransferase
MQVKHAPLRALTRLTEPPLLTAFAVLQAGLLAVVAATHLSSLVDPKEAGAHPGTGDFAAFYTGALLVRQGEGRELFDFEAQKRVQEEVFGAPLPYQQRYLYPPGPAVALAVVSAAGYVPAFLAFTAIMAASLAFGLVMLVRALPELGRCRRTRWTTALLLASFLPVALTTFGGQNTALSLGLFAALYAALHSRREVMAGILLGLLTFKPQYVLIPGLVLLGMGHRRTVGVAAGVGLLHFAAGGLVVGWSWPLDLLSALAEHAPREFTDNGHLHFSVPAVVRRVWGDTAASIAAATAGLAGLLVLLLAARRIRGHTWREPAFFGLLVLITLLSSPHLQYYEAGLLALPAVLALESLAATHRTISLSPRLLLVIGYFGFPAWRLSHGLGFQPLVIPLLAIGGWLIHELFGPAREVAVLAARDQITGTNRSLD